MKPGPMLYWASPSGGAFSTLDDLGNLLQMFLRPTSLLASQVVSSTKLREMLGPVVVNTGKGCTKTCIASEQRIQTCSQGLEHHGK